ncbi:protein asteroid-like [Amphibalanus amphitrite]|uniref:protein asteroid-like n=1 Tax=Amphibalanus amphitrite TaxID=1232801 RepID=UPI001C900457|nr:protein asteroid-like [Amphibalanus amphitrite]
MGVRGLSTFIKERRDKFLVRHKLCNEVVILDGDNVIHYINANSKGLNFAFGGDYQKYAWKVEAFFNNLQRCGITPIVLLDGGSDPSNRKLKTAFSRLTSKLEVTRKLAPTSQHRHTCLPLLTKAAFVEVLNRLGLPYAVCPFEADEPVAALARHLSCSVVSDDTDFFAFGVRCVPLGSLSAEPECGLDGQPYMDCTLFRHDRFMEEYGLRPQLMPLLACLLGNDYISPGSLRAFFRHVPRPYGQRRGRPSALRISGALAWLRRHTDPEEALQEVLSLIRKEERAIVGQLVRRLMDNYSQCGWSEDLIGQLRLPPGLVGTTAEQDSEVLPSTEESESQPVDRLANLSLNGTAESLKRTRDEPDAASDDDLSDDGSEDMEDVSDDASEDYADADVSGDDVSGCDDESSAVLDGRLLLDGAPPPGWLSDALRRGQCTNDVINLMSGQPLLEEPQVEDPRQRPSCVCVEPLLRWLCTCLHGQPDRAVTVYRRADSGRSVVRRQLAPPAADAPQPPPLAAVPAMTLAERRHAVLMALGAPLVPSSSSEKNSVPGQTPLAVPECTQEPAKESERRSAAGVTLGAALDVLPERHHLLAAALCYWRRHSVAPVTAAHLGALLLPERRSEPGVSRLAGPDPRLLSGDVSFEQRVAHQLAQLQCVLAQANNINTLMGAPLQLVSPSRVFAGPLVYNALMQLRRLGLEAVEQWLTEPALREWRRELELLCRVTGVDPELRPAKPVLVPAAKASRPAAGEVGKTKEVGDGMGRSKTSRRARPQPQLTGNKFAALLQDSDGGASGDDSDASGDS